MTIRAATKQDIPQLMHLAEQSETASHWTQRQYEVALSGGPPTRIILVIGEEQIFGFAVSAEIAGEWELENIVVAADQQRKGIGSKLLRALLDYAGERGGAAMFLEVRESNRSARFLYEFMGFRVSGRRPGYYHNPSEDAILYKKFLSPAVPEIG